MPFLPQSIVLAVSHSSTITKSLCLLTYLVCLHGSLPEGRSLFQTHKVYGFSLRFLLKNSSHDFFFISSSAAMTRFKNSIYWHIQSSPYSIFWESGVMPMPYDANVNNIVLACPLEYNMLYSTMPCVIFCLQHVNGNNPLSQVHQCISITIDFFFCF